MVNPGYAPGAAAPQEGNGLAVAALVLGILSIVLFWFPFVNWILALLAIIFGAIGMAKGKRVGKGRGMAITGLVCGVLCVAISVISILFFVSKAKDIDKELQRELKEQQQQHEKDMK